MFSANPATRLGNLPISANFVQQMQNPQKPMLQTVHFPENIGLQCPKDIFSTGSDENNDDEEVFTLNKKKVKVDTSNDNKQPTMTQGYQATNMQVNPNLQQFINTNSGDKMMINTAPQLSNILIGNNNIPKNENIQYIQYNQPMQAMQSMQGLQNMQPIQGLQNMQPMYVPINVQGNNSGMVQYIPVQQQQQQTIQQSPIQNFAQSIKIKPNMSYEPSVNVSPVQNNKDNNGGSNLEEMMKGVQNQLVDLLFAQNKMLVDLREKNELVQDTLACLINEVNALKQVVKQNKNEKNKLEQVTMLPHMVESSREAATSEILFNQLYGAKQDFQYQLVFKNELSLPLYRERNFKFTVMLADKDGNLVKNSNRIPLTIAIYTSENPPKFVDVNTSGNKILKGMIDKDMVDGSVTFDKIQIKEVTSHFRNGWVFFVVYPKTTVLFNPIMSGANALLVNSNQIKPIVLEKVVVKAKRSKEREEKGAEMEQEMSCDGDDNKIYEPEQ